MSLLLAVVLLSLILEDDNLLTFSVLYNAACYSCINVRSSYLYVLAFSQYKHLIKGYSFTNFCI